MPRAGFGSTITGSPPSGTGRHIPRHRTCNADDLVHLGHAAQFHTDRGAREGRRWKGTDAPLPWLPSIHDFKITPTACHFVHRCHGISPVSYTHLTLPTSDLV